MILAFHLCFNSPTSIACSFVYIGMCLVSLSRVARQLVGSMDDAAVDGVSESV